MQVLLLLSPLRFALPIRYRSLCQQKYSIYHMPVPQILLRFLYTIAAISLNWAADMAVTLYLRSTVFHRIRFCVSAFQVPQCQGWLLHQVTRPCSSDSQKILHAKDSSRSRKLPYRRLKIESTPSVDIICLLPQTPTTVE